MEMNGIVLSPDPRQELEAQLSEFLLVDVTLDERDGFQIPALRAYGPVTGPPPTAHEEFLPGRPLTRQGLDPSGMTAEVDLL